MSNAELAKKVAAAGGQNSPAVFEATIGEWFKINKRKMATMAGDLQTAQQIVVALIQAVNRTPKLMTCKPETLFACLMNSAATCLFPGALQECAYVPFANNKSQTVEAVWMPMYGGLIKLAFNSGHLRGVSTEVVYEADEFDYSLGSQPFVHHRPFLGEQKDRGERIAVYNSCETMHGRIVTVKSMAFIEGIKKRSRGAGSSDSPWSNGNPDDYDAMARKTVLKQGLKSVPKSPRLAVALDLDNAQERPDLAGSSSPFLDGLEMAARLGVNGPESPPTQQGQRPGPPTEPQRQGQQPSQAPPQSGPPQQPLGLGDPPDDSAPGTGKNKR